MNNVRQISKKEVIGIALICLEPLFHNLHNFMWASKIASVPMSFYVDAYWFLFAFLHSFAPLTALFGAFLLIPHKAKHFLWLPMVYQAYKSLEKVPLRPDYNIQDEFIMLGAMFTGVVILLIWYIVTPEKPEDQKKFDKYFKNTLKELNLKKK